MSGVDAALAGASGTPFWLDRPDRPLPRPALPGDLVADLAVVGGGLTGLWAAVLAAEAEPNRSVVLLEAGRLAWAASGRNGGFCSASLTHGLDNAAARWPSDLATLVALGDTNLAGIEDTVRRHGIGCDFRRAAELTVAVQPWHLSGLAETHQLGRRLGLQLELLDAAETRALVNSPSYLGAVLDRTGLALVDPARLAWGLAATAERLGVGIHEDTLVLSVRDEGDRVLLRTTHGAVRVRRVVLGTNAFGSPLPAVRRRVVPVWDHVLVTEPLTDEQLAPIGWAGREGVSDAGNQFHYYRLTADRRLLWGGYDAVYYYGSDVSSGRARRATTERLLAEQLLAAFPSLHDVRFSHTWGGAIDTCTRFTAFWQRGLGGKLAAVQGYTGLGVGASRFGAQVALDLVDGRQTTATRLAMVRRRPLPFPPEPIRWAGIELTRRQLARADARDGRRGPWLRTLDALGLGYDS